MDSHEIRCLTSMPERTFFVPPINPRVFVTGTAKRLNVWSGPYLGWDDFEREDLLLMQDQYGCYWWAFFENLFTQDSKMSLHPCSLCHTQADSIVKARILFIADSDIRLCDFSLLSRCSKPPTIDETSEKIDLSSRHLASTREVHIFTIGPDGKRACDEVKTADYYRAKADIKHNPADTRNMRRFCNRQRNGEGSSNWNSRICHGHVPPRASWSPPRPSSPSRMPSGRLSISSSTSTAVEPYLWQAPTPELQRTRSTNYYILKLVSSPNAKVEAHQHNYDLKHARREKRPEGYKPPSRWTAMVKRARGFCRGGQWKRSLDAERVMREEYSGVHDGRRRRHPRSNLSGYISCRRSSSATLVEEDDISPLMLPAPAMEGGRAAGWVEIVETFSTSESVGRAPSAVKDARRAERSRTFSKVDVIDGVPKEAHALR